MRELMNDKEERRTTDQVFAIRPGWMTTRLKTEQESYQRKHRQKSVGFLHTISRLTYLSHSHVTNKHGANDESEQQTSPPTSPATRLSEFCAAERSRRVTLYRLWKQGKGPRF